MSWIDWIKDAGNTIVNNVAKPVYDNVVIPVYDTVVQPIVDIVVKPAYIKIYDWTDSDQAKEIYEKGKQVGVDISDSFVSGANQIHAGLGDDIKEIVNNGWEETKDFSSEQSCNLVIGGVLTIAIGEVITTSKALSLEEKLAFKASSNYNPSTKKQLIVDFSKDFATLFTETIYNIPSVSGSKDELECIISFCIYQSLLSDNSNMLSIKDFFSGALVCGLTSYICNGTAPDGFSDWKKQNF
jgi:hypothetical protein